MAICVKTGNIFKMRSTSFFHVSVPNIYGTSSSAYLIIFLKVISKVLFFNITQKFTNLLVQPGFASLCKFWTSTIIQHF